MADAITTFATISADAPNVYIGRRMYELAERNLVLGKFARQESLPQRMGTTLRLVRYKRFALPVAPLSEGVNPDAVAMATENVDVTVNQYGLVAFLSDVAEVTVVHPVLSLATERVSLAMSEFIERELATTLMNGTNIEYAGGVASRSALDGTKKLTTADILRTITGLRARGAMPYDGNMFAVILPPQLEADILGTDPAFQNARAFRSDELDQGEIGRWMGGRYYRSNFLPYLKGVPAPTTAAATAERAQHSMSGTGGATDNSKIRIVARDATTDYERKISQDLTVADADAAFTLTLPTSTNYVYDVYMSNTSGTAFKRVFTRQAASAVLSFTSTTYSAATELRTPPAPPADQKEVFVAFVCGKDAFGRVTLDGQSLQSFLTPPGPSFSNPLALGRKVGAKVMWKPFLLEDAFLTRIEANSTYSANLPA